MFKYLIVVIAAVLLTWKLKPHDPSPTPAAPALVSVQGMGHLATLRMNYSNVIEFNQRSTQDIPWTDWELRFGGTKVLLIARGDCVVGTDLRGARYEKEDATARTATLVLPTPTTITARINHEMPNGSYFYAMSSTGLEPMLPNSNSRQKAVDSALAKAQQDIARACAAPDIVAAAKSNAEAVLKPTLAVTGWKVALAWR